MCRYVDSMCCRQSLFWYSTRHSDHTTYCAMAHTFYGVKLGVLAMYLEYASGAEMSHFSVAGEREGYFGSMQFSEMFQDRKKRRERRRGYWGGTRFYLSKIGGSLRILLSNLDGISFWVGEKGKNVGIDDDKGKRGEHVITCTQVDLVMMY